MEGTWLGPAVPMEGAVWLSQTCGAQGQREQSGALVGGPPEGGSELGPGVALQQSTHVQKRLFQVMCHAGSVGLSTAVVGRHGEVDVGLHGVVAHAIAIWDHGPEGHDAVCLGRDLGKA